ERIVASIFSPDGNWLGTRTYSGTVRLWNTSTRQGVAQLDKLGKCRTGIAFSPDSQRLAVALGTGDVRFFDVPSLAPVGPVLVHGPTAINGIAFSTDGKTMVTVAADTLARFWDTETGAKLAPGPLKHDNELEAVALSPDGSVLVTSTERTRKVYRWEAATGKLLGVLPPFAGPCYSLSFHPDGKRFLPASNDLTARQWDARTGTPVGPMIRLARGAYQGAYSPDGQLFATAAADKTVRLWDKISGRQHGPALYHADGAVAVGFHPAGTLLVSGGWDQSARLWRLGGWKPSLAVTMGEHVGSVVSVPGSDMVLVGSGSEAAFLDLTTSQTKPLV